MRFTGGLPETRCGLGSTMVHTAGIREWIPHLLKTFHIRSIVDAPCGDLNWMRRLDIDFDYIGLDSDPDHIAKAKAMSYLHVRLADITTDELPEADLILCRDFLQHIPNAKAMLFLDSLRGKFDWLLATCHTNASNSDIERDGDFRQLNLMRAPFSFDEPVVSCPDGEERTLALWKLKC